MAIIAVPNKLAVDITRCNLFNCFSNYASPMFCFRTLQKNHIASLNLFAKVLFCLVSMCLCQPYSATLETSGCWAELIGMYTADGLLSVKKDIFLIPALLSQDKPALNSFFL